MVKAAELLAGDGYPPSISLLGVSGIGTFHCFPCIFFGITICDSGNGEEKSGESESIQDAERDGLEYLSFIMGPHQMGFIIPDGGGSFGCPEIGKDIVNSYELDSLECA